MTRYAENTSVSVDKSRSEIERTLERYGASAFGYMKMNDQAVIEFMFGTRRIRFVLPLPDRLDKEFLLTPARKTARTDAQAYEAWEQACRQRWRALNIAIKAKLEAVETGISSFDEEFLSHIVLPNNMTVGEHVAPGLEEAYSSGSVPPLLAISAAN